MTRSLTLFAAAVLAFSAIALVPQPAAAGGDVKFFVVEWRLTWVDAPVRTNEDGTTTTAPLELKLKGKASLDGVDFDKDFEMVVKDATPYLEILRTCGMGRLSGMVDDYDTESRTVLGRRMSELNCRAILK